MINIQSALRTSADLCKKISLALLFGINGNSNTLFTLSSMCLYMHTHILHKIETLVGQKKYKHFENSECRVPFWAHVPQFRSALL